MHRLVREVLLERLALDRDRRELREEQEDLPVLVVGQARLGDVHVERAEHARRRRCATIGIDHDACRPCVDRDVAVLGRPVVGRDVAHVHRLAQVRGRAARSRRWATPACRRATSRKRGARLGAAPTRSVDVSASSSMIAHENRGKWPSSAAAIVEQRLVERDTAGDLLEDLGLVRGELGGAALIGDVVADRLVLDDLAGCVGERAVGPLVPTQRPVERHLALDVGAHESPVGERLQALEHARRVPTRAGDRRASLPPRSSSLQPKNSANARLANVSVASGRYRHTSSVWSSTTPR